MSNPPTTEDRIVSLAEAATITDLSIDTLRRCGKRNELRIQKLSPRRVGVQLSDLHSFLERRASAVPGPARGLEAAA